MCEIVFEVVLILYTIIFDGLKAIDLYINKDILSKPFALDLFG